MTANAPSGGNTPPDDDIKTGLSFDLSTMDNGSTSIETEDGSQGATRDIVLRVNRGATVVCLVKS